MLVHRNAHVVKRTDDALDRFRIDDIFRQVIVDLGVRQKTAILAQLDQGFQLLAATLEFLAVIDYALPAWAKTYMGAMEKSLGKAYAEPAADVRGYIAHVKSQRK